MKLKELFSIIIKVFGFFIIKDILATLPYLITPILSLANSDPGIEWGTLIVSMLSPGAIFLHCLRINFQNRFDACFFKIGATIKS